MAATRLTFDDAIAEGTLDRPVELVIREVEGLPCVARKAVVDAFRGAGRRGLPLGVFGPMISESAVPLREEIERWFPGARDHLVRGGGVARRMDVLALERLHVRRALRDRQPRRTA